MTRRPHLRRLTAALLLAVTAAGCATVRSAGSYPAAESASRAAADPTSGGLEVAVFADDRARRALHPSPPYVVGILERETDGAWETVFRSLQPVWSLAALPPGKYRLRFPEVLDAEGRPQAVDGAEKAFRVAAGEVRRFEATLEHVPRGWIAAGIFTAVVVGVLLDDWLGDHLEPPPIPAGVVLDLVFYLTLDLRTPDATCCAPRPPIVTSHFPRQEDVVAARRLRVLFALSEPLGEAPRRDAVRVTGERSGRLAGEVGYDAERWWVTWTPASDLPRDEVITVELLPGSVVDRAGYPLERGASFAFRTTP